MLMLNDGEDHVAQLLKVLRPDVQLLCFTATWDDLLPCKMKAAIKTPSGESRMVPRAIEVSVDCVFVRLPRSVRVAMRLLYLKFS